MILERNGVASAPSETRRDLHQNGFDHVGVVVDSELIGHGQKQSVGLRDSFVLRELPDEYLRLSSVAAAEDGARVVAEEADLVIAFIAASEVGAVAVVHQRENA